MYSEGERKKSERLTLLACRNEKFGRCRGGKRELQIHLHRNMNWIQITE